MFNNQIIAGAAGQGGSFYPYSINQSLRFDDGSNHKLTRTPSSAGNRQTWSVSMWVKRSKLGVSQQQIFEAGTSGAASSRLFWYFNSSDKIQLSSGDTNYGAGSIQLRDVGSWYHLLFRATGGTVYIYVNGVLDNSHSISGNLAVNSTIAHNFFSRASQSNNNEVDGYLAQAAIFDGTAYTYDQVTETENGILVPKDLSGLTFGTNGVLLEFGDSSAIGDDTSGNSNDFTATNLAASDVVPDSPTNNFATNNGAMRANITQSEGNLKMVGVGNNYDNLASTFEIDAEDTDGWYWEYRSIGNDTATGVGIAVSNNQYFNQSDSANPFAHENQAGNVHYQGDGNKRVSGGSATSYGDSWTAGDIIGVAVKAGAVYFYKNGTIQNSGTAAQTGITGKVVPAFAINGTNSGTANYGQDSTFAGTETAASNSDTNGLGEFSQTVPSGYKALCSANLPEPTIGPNSATQATDHFDVKLWSSDVVNPAAGDKQISLDFQPDWVWSKDRAAGESHYWVDSVRGDNDGSKLLMSDRTNAEGGDAVGNTTAKYNFTSSGFDIIDTNSASGEVYYNAGSASSPRSYVGWCWKAGGTAVSNTDGSITSSVSAAPDAGFSIVSYTGTGGSGTYGHGLGVEPNMIMTKDRTDPAAWAVYVSDIGTGKYLELDQTDATTTTAAIYPSVSSTTIGVGVQGDGSITNTSGDEYISYCFANVEGYCKVGSYVGNGNANGTFVYTGFRPAWVMVKQTTTAENWLMFDNKRSTFNLSDDRLMPNSNATEATDNGIDILSNGFKFRTTNSASNESGQTFIYLAFAEAPFKYANAR